MIESKLTSEYDDNIAATASIWGGKSSTVYGAHQRPTTPNILARYKMYNHSHRILLCLVVGVAPVFFAYKLWATFELYVYLRYRNYFRFGLEMRMYEYTYVWELLYTIYVVLLQYYSTLKMAVKLLAWAPDWHVNTRVRKSANIFIYMCVWFVWNANYNAERRSETRKHQTTYGENKHTHTHTYSTDGKIVCFVYLCIYVRTENTPENKQSINSFPILRIDLNIKIINSQTRQPHVSKYQGHSTFFQFSSNCAWRHVLVVLCWYFIIGHLWWDTPNVIYIYLCIHV